ncbi:MAG: L-lactate permease [Alphaproteobacteria bacterium]|nr:L-lactate permease [Alphaproteobacteria bacterium]MCB9930584.1 L-lactate permease [Alphaproteobacteria bacterium]
MLALLSLLPCAVVVVAVLLLRTSGLVAALLALAAALALWVAGVFAPWSALALPHAVEDGLLLTTLVGSVIVPGLLFVEICRRAGSLDAVGRVIEAMELDAPRAAIVIVTGVGIMLESLTGFGVSLLVSVPLLLARFERGPTIALGLIGMSLMPWGALSVSALLGAKLAGLPVEVLAERALTTSGPIAAVLPLACLLFTPRPDARAVGFAMAAGLALVAGLAATSYAIGVEVAGVGGGLAVLALAGLIAPDRRRVARAVAAPSLALLGILIAGVVAQKLLVPVLAAAGFAPVAGTGRVGYAVLTSPGIALVAAACIGLVVWHRRIRRPDAPLVRLVATRTWRALLTIAIFLSMARLLVETGGIGALSALLAQAGEHTAVALVAALGGVGAYVTGSAIPSAALFMPSAAATGQSFGLVSLFAALQHSAAGHIAMASLPIAAILVAALPNRSAADEREALRRGLQLAAVWLAMVIASGWIQL